MSICGSVTCSVVDALETNGVNVELWGACSCTEVLSSVDNNGIDYIRESGDHLCTLIKIKDSEQYPNIGLIDFVTGDSYFYRNIIFKDRIYTSACMLKTHGVSYRGMLGHSYNITKDILPYDESYNIDLDIIIPRIYKIEEAETWLSTTFIDMLNKITKETEE